MSTPSDDPAEQLELFWNELKETIQPWLIGIVLLGIGTLLTWQYGQIPVVAALAEAILIAGILTLVVDPFLKTRLVKEASRGIFHWLLGFNQPDEIQDRLRRLVTNEKLFRRKFNMRCDLARSNGKMLLTIEYDFEVFNPTYETQKFTQEIGFEKSEHPKVYRLTYISAHDQAENYDDTSPEVLHKPDNPEPCTWRGPEVSISPKREGYRFSGKYSLEFPEEYYYAQIFGHTTIGAKFVVASHPDDIKVSANPTPRHSGNVWEYDQLFMQQEHINLRWTKKTNS